MPETDEIPEGFEPIIVESVRHEPTGEIIITYAGRIFGGIMKEPLPEGVVDEIRQGAELFVRYAEPAGDARRQVVHVIMRHPTQPGWAELYADWE